MTDQPRTPIFRTPEEVAPDLGMSPGELRRYCRVSGICTRLSRNRIMLHQDDIDGLVVWVRKYKAAELKAAREHDPFA